MASTDVIAATPSVRAERIPVRAEPLLVRHELAKKSESTGPVSSNSADAPGDVLRSMANVRYTLPPGALEDAASKDGKLQKPS